MRPDRRGFILPTTLMVLTLLTVMLTAAFILVSAEFRTTDNSLAINRANAIAQAGLQDYLSRIRSLTPTSTYDSLRITFSDGYADVIGKQLIAASSGKVPVWLIRSTGYLSSASLTGQTTAQGMVAQLAQLNAGVLPVKGAFIAANPVAITGTGSPPIDGTDNCGTLDTADMVVAAADIVIGGGTPNQGTWGIPKIRSAFSRAAILDSTHIDWASLLAGNFTPDYIVPAWPGAYTGYPIFYAPGDLTLPALSSRQGVLVVRGNLFIGLAAYWYGIIIVGGRVVAPILSLTKVKGTVISGLNNLTAPGSVGTDTIPRGLTGWGFIWDSCEATSAAGGMAGMAPMRHTLIDTWSTY